MTTDTEAMLEQPPAADKDGEASILGACMLATPAYDPVADAARIIKDGDWYRPAHETVWSAIRSLHGRSEPTGLPMVVAELTAMGELERVGGRVALSEMVRVACSSAEVEHYAALVHGYAKVRALQASLGRGLQMARQTAPDAVTDTVRAVQTELDFLAAGGEADRHFGRLGDDLHAHLESLETTEEAAAVTGLVDLDEVLMMLAGNVVVVAGRPGMGKSALTLGVAIANASSGRPTLVHSMEMGRKEVNNRILAARSRVSLRRLLKGGPAIEDDDWTRLARHVPDLQTLPVWMDYSSRVSPSRVRHRVQTITRETGRPPLVIVDYLQLMETDQRSSRQSPYERVSEISRELKIVAEETGAVIICCAQLNRGAESRDGKRPQVSDLRDSGQIEQDASAIILLHREDAYDPYSARAGEVDLIIGKNRNGSLCTVTVAHQLHYGRIRDMAALDS
ncbi:DnaB-like helicase C-terminal domain-containing protein [Streptomyces sp. Ag109_O5-10]|uniref:replicative DNA helicase n=1 Tax=Streptomyces sp. Ag109_O5-10 TaxID=1855349 RepID=UPI0008979852|nr:DnaB-like helicase C-terminal domain-containing protein [Streptomyces sp. Ag109_O5-10]SEF18984.1 replicative DNA helicase [Streptomyces sp. Ag109_O5-10]